MCYICIGKKNNMDYNVYKGRYYYCIRSVIMRPSEEEAYTKGKVYHSAADNCLTDNQGDANHGVYPGFTEKYFVPVDAVIKAYTEGVINRCNKNAV